MTDEKVPYATLVQDFSTDGLEEGESVVAIFGLVKLEDAEGDEQWAVRSGGEPISAEELLGALRGLAASMERDLADEWEW